MCAHEAALSHTHLELTLHCIDWVQHTTSIQHTDGELHPTRSNGSSNSLGIWKALVLISFAWLRNASCFLFLMEVHPRTRKCLIM